METTTEALEADMDSHGACPRHIKIGYRRYTISIASASTLSDNGRKGECNHRLAQITLADDLPLDNMAETLLHEILHAIFRDAGLDWGEEEEERMVERISPRIAALLADNRTQVNRLAQMLCGHWNPSLPPKCPQNGPVSDPTNHDSDLELVMRAANILGSSVLHEAGPLAKSLRRIAMVTWPDEFWASGYGTDYASDGSVINDDFPEE